MSAKKRRNYRLQHCELGRDMLNESGLPKRCLDLVLRHNERLDGSGYPFRLG